MLPLVVTFNPPLDEIERVPVPFPNVTLFVPVPRLTAPDPFRVNVPDPWLYPVTAEIAPELITIPLIVLLDVAAVIAPAEVTEKFEPPITVGPVPSPSVNVPVPFASSVRLVSAVDAEMVGLFPAKVRAEEVRVSWLIVPVTSKLST